MQLTIVYPDDLVVIDRYCKTIPLEPFDTPDNFQALQWSNDSGQIEYTDYAVEPITELPAWAMEIVDEFNRLRGIESDLIRKQQQSEVYVSNGTARVERNRQRLADEAKAYMAEQMKMIEKLDDLSRI